MATEPAEESETTVRLPAALVEWLDERAAAESVDRDELLVQLLSAYQTTATQADDGETDIEHIETALSASLEDRISAIESELTAVESVSEQLQTLESRHDSDMDDVRNRVLQLKGAIRNLAPADHTHYEFSKFRSVIADVSELEKTIEQLDTRLLAIDERVEEISTELSDSKSKLDRLARALVSLRDQLNERTAETDSTTDRIKQEAAVQGIHSAKCPECKNSVEIALLTEPACPYCEVLLKDVKPPSWFFGSATFVETETPALEGANE